MVIYPENAIEVGGVVRHQEGLVEKLLGGNGEEFGAPLFFPPLQKGGWGFESAIETNDLAVATTAKATIKRTKCRNVPIAALFH